MKTAVGAATPGRHFILAATQAEGKAIDPDAIVFSKPHHPRGRSIYKGDKVTILPTVHPMTLRAFHPCMVTADRPRPN